MIETIAALTFAALVVAVAVTWILFAAWVGVLIASAVAGNLPSDPVDLIMTLLVVALCSWLCCWLWDGYKTARAKESQRGE